MHVRANLNGVTGEFFKNHIDKLVYDSFGARFQESFKKSFKVKMIKNGYSVGRYCL